MMSIAGAAVASTLRADRRDIVWLLAFSVSLNAILVAAWLPFPALFAAALLVVYIADVQSARRLPKIFELLEKNHLGSFSRQLLCDTALILLAWRSGVLPAKQMAAFAGAMTAVYVATVAFLLLREYAERRRSLPIETRNLDLSALRIPSAPRPAFLLDARRSWAPLQTAPAVVGVLAAILFDSAGYAVAGAVLSAAIALAALGVLLWTVLRARHLGNRAWVLRETRAEILRYAPEVLLYHSGLAGTAYQVNMWLSALEGLDRRAIVVLRQRGHLADLDPTVLPVLCIPSGTDVMEFNIPTIKLALYVGNVGDNQHLIRHAGMKHVFIGHGDSDKSASANRVSKIYDEVWVAGPAGRERYRNADVGVADSDIVEVGRPQLDDVGTCREHPAGPFTVLYAPTWEGWSDDMFLTSVPTMGEEIVRILLGTPNLRVIYKPHPLTGLRNAAVKRAHRGIIRLIATADGVPASLDAEARQSRDAAKRRFAELSAELKRASARTRARGDGAQAARDSAPDPGTVASIAARQAELHELFWVAQDPGAHVVVDSRFPSLFSCFNHADLLISDISSVVSDFTAADKPYVVTNAGGVARQRFLEENTAARGAYLLSRADDELPTILATIRGGEPDPLVAARRDAREFLLGPRIPTATTRFDAAVESLIERAAPPKPPARIPAPRTVKVFEGA